jgi:hypothetical protein
LCTLLYPVSRTISYGPGWLCIVVGDANHQASMGSTTFTIARGSSALTVTCAAGPFYYTGSPITPCTAIVTGVGGLSQALPVNYSNNTGVGTVMANAAYAGDPNHNAGTGWTLKGCYPPVDMGGTALIYNTVKNGSTVPLRFEIIAGATKLVDVVDVKSLTYAQTSCDVTATTDDIETLATGGTLLRYGNTSAGQFVYNGRRPRRQVNATA